MGPNWVSIGLTAMFLIGGALFWIFLPEIWIGQIWVGVGLLLATLQIWMKLKTDFDIPDGADEEALANQYQASATVAGDMGAQIMAALEKSGIDPTKGGTYDLSNLPQARDAVLNALKASGIDVAHQVAMVAPAVGAIQPTGEPVERMTKLEQLKSAGLISNEEFESNRQRILEGL